MDNLHNYFVVFLILSLLYAGLLIVWGRNWYKHRNHAGIPLHKYIGFTLLCQCIVMLTLEIYYPVRWHEINNGENAQKSYIVAVIFEIFVYIATSIFYSMLVLIAIGWCIIEHDLSTTKVLGLCVFVFAYLVVELVKFTTTDDLKTYASLVYAELLLFIGVLVYVIIKTHYHIRKLTLQISPEPDLNVEMAAPPSSESVSLSEIRPKPSNAEQEATEEEKEEGVQSVRIEPRDEEPEGETQREDGGESGGAGGDEMTIPEATEKLKLFQYFYKLFTVYIIALVLVKYFEVSVSTIPVICGMYLDFAFMCGVCYVFRLRNANQYFYLVNEE